MNGNWLKQTFRFRRRSATPVKRRAVDWSRWLFHHQNMNMPESRHTRCNAFKPHPESVIPLLLLNHMTGQTSTNPVSSPWSPPPHWGCFLFFFFSSSSFFALLPFSPLSHYRPPLSPLALRYIFLPRTHLPLPLFVLLSPPLSSSCLSLSCCCLPPGGFSSASNAG